MPQGSPIKVGDLIVNLYEEGNMDTHKYETLWKAVFEGILDLQPLSEWNDFSLLKEFMDDEYKKAKANGYGTME